MASSLVNLAYSESLNGRRENAVRYLKQVLRFGQALKDPNYILDAYINLADLEIQDHKYKAGLDYYMKALEELKAYPVPDYELYVYWGLAQNYFHLGQYYEAYKTLTKSIEVGESINALNELRKIYLLGSEIHEKLNDPTQALDYRKKYQVLNDSLVNAETQQSVHKLEIEYQTSVKEKAIAEQELIIANNQVEIQRKNIMIILAVSIVLALILVFIISFLVYRHKRKAYAEKLQYIQKQNEIQVLTAMMEGEEKERSRLARELHDGVGGILSATKMHLSILRNDEISVIDTAKLEQPVSMIDYASQEIRTIAHNLSPNILLHSDLDKAIKHFCQSVSNSALHVDCYVLGEFPQFNHSFKLVIYRIIQELINNIMTIRFHNYWCAM
jgi:tetratricopeptide (TPR) repeat protein